MDVSYSELSRLTGKTYRIIRSRLEAARVKPIESGEKGKSYTWDSVTALEAIYSNVSFADNGVERDFDFEKERARAEKERADKLELENARRRGELLEAAEVGRELSTVLVSFKTKLSGLPSRLSAMVDDPEERRRLFIEAKAIVDEALIDMAKGIEDCTG